MITKKFCPDCGSEEVMMVAGGITGTWMCKDCGFTGMFPEKEIIGREMKETGAKDNDKGKARRRK